MSSRNDRLFPTPDPGERLRFAFLLGSERELSATIGEVSQDGLAVRCDRAAGPLLEIGSAQEARIHGASFADPVRTRVLVRSRRIERTSVRYGLGFGMDGESRDEEVLQALFNPRGTVRVTPAPGEAIDVSLHVGAGGRKITCDLVDISLDGMAVRADKSTDCAIASAKQMLVAFRLPVGDMELRFCAVSVYAELEGEHVRYGFEFARGCTSEAERMREILGAYVMRRQSEMIRTAAS